MRKDYFDIFDAISFTVRTLKDRDDDFGRPLIMHAMALAGLARDEDEFITALLFYCTTKWVPSLVSIERRPVDREIIRAVRLMQLNTDDHIPDPFRHRIDGMKRDAASEYPDTKLAGELAITTFYRYIALEEKRLLSDIARFESRHVNNLKYQKIIQRCRSSLRSVQSEKDRLVHAFGKEPFKL